MKNIVVLCFVFLFFTVSQAFAYKLTDFSSDSKILEAMAILEQAGETEVFANLKKNSVKVRFYNLSAMSAGQSVYAANTYDQYGRRVILINSIYKTAPVEQIACLIAHESCHTARKATLEEETRATQKEAMCWIKLKNNYVTYPQNKLTRRLDKLAGLQSSGNNAIQNTIASSSFYRNQLGLN